MLTHTYSAGSPTVMSFVLFCGRFSIRCTSLLSNQILQTCRWIPSKANTWDECILNSPKLPSNIMGIRFCNKCYIITWSHLFDRRTLEENFIANIINNIYKQEKKCFQCAISNADFCFVLKSKPNFDILSWIKRDWIWKECIYRPMQYLHRILEEPRVELRQLNQSTL